MANVLSGMFFLRAQAVQGDKTTWVPGQIGPAVGHDPGTQLGLYLCRFPGRDGAISHSVLVSAVEFSGKEFVLFDSKEQLQDFLTARLPPSAPESAVATVPTP